MSDYGDDDAQGALDDYDGGYDEIDEPQEPEIDAGEDGADDVMGGTEDPDARRPVGGDNVVVGGDATAGAKPTKNAVVALKEKKVANDKRSTTPYMTKYERARVLGTRALQIRFALFEEQEMAYRGLTGLSA